MKGREPGCGPGMMDTKAPSSPQKTAHALLPQEGRKGLGQRHTDTTAAGYPVNFLPRRNPERTELWKIGNTGGVGSVPPTNSLASSLADFRRRPPTTC